MMYDEGFSVHVPGTDFFNFFMYLEGERVGISLLVEQFTKYLWTDYGRLVSSQSQ